jgi:hypothetical protein
LRDTANREPELKGRTMEKSLEFLEIFGSNDIQPSPPEPVSPLDDPMWDFLPVTSAGAALCQKLQDDDLKSKLIGAEDLTQLELAPIRAPVPAAPTSDGSTALADFIKSWIGRTVEASAAKPPASDATARWDSAKHETAIRAIVNRARTADVFAPIKDSAFDGLWDRLVRSCLNHVCTIVHEAAEEAA